MRNTVMALVVTALLLLPQAAKGDNMAVSDGNKVIINYTLTVEGEVVDTTQGKDPLEYQHGTGQIIPGLESEITGMQVGDEKTVNVSAADAYGPVNEDAFKEVPLSFFPEGITPQVGMMLPLQSENGQPLTAFVSEINDNGVILNFNHPLAGKDLTFQIEIVAIQ